MLSTRLVRLIEGNWEEITKRLIQTIRSHPEMQVFASRPEAEIREWCQDILKNLGYLLTARNEDEVKNRFRLLGRTRFEENVPLSEAVLRLHLLKEKIIGFIQEQGLPMTAVELYAEEELAKRMGRFFDASVYQVVRGYQEAQRLARRMAS